MTDPLVLEATVLSNVPLPLLKILHSTLTLITRTNTMKDQPDLQVLIFENIVHCSPNLLSQLWDSQCPVLLATSGGKRCKSGHEKVQPREWDHVRRKFPEVSIQLTREPQAGGDA